MSLEKSSKFGIVILKDWMNNPLTAHEVRTVAGPIRLVTAKEFDFQPKGNETNWGVLVGNEESNVLILGCQIRSVYWGAKIPLPGESLNCWVFKE